MSVQRDSPTKKITVGSTDRRQPLHHCVSPIKRKTSQYFKMKWKLYTMTQQAGYPLRGKSSVCVCVMCLKNRIILLLIIIVILILGTPRFFKSIRSQDRF